MSRPLGRIQHGCSSAGRKTLCVPADGAAEDKLRAASFISRFSSVNPQQEGESNDFRLETAMIPPSLTSTSSVGPYLCLGLSVFIVVSLAWFTFLCESVSPSHSCLFSQQISSQPWLAHSRDIRWQGHLFCFNSFSQSAVCVCVYMFVCVSVTEEDAEIESEMASQHLRADLI